MLRVTRMKTLLFPTFEHLELSFKGFDTQL